MLLPEKLVLPILMGPLRGCPWLIASGNLPYWIGNYEREQVLPFTQSLFANAIVYDIGAHAGYYTIIASRKVGEGGKVIAFEPLPKNVFNLEKNVRINKLENVRIVESAISDNDGTALFSEGKGSYEGKIDPCGKIEVNVKSIDSLVETGNYRKPDILKIDVEGSEFRVLLGAKNCLAKFRPRVFLSIHSLEMEKSCISFLSSINYRILKLQCKKGYVSEIMAY